MSQTNSGSDFTLRMTIPGGEGDGPVQEFQVTGGVGIIGRDEKCTVVLPDRSVSRRHAQIESTPEGFKVTDLGSGNGVWVNNRRVGEQLLRRGQTFQIGGYVFECVGQEPDVAESAEATVLIQPTTEEPPTEAEPDSVSLKDFVLRIVESVEAGRAGDELTITGGTATIGREKGCTVVLDDRDVSRRHARIEWTPDGFRITDLGSTNGVFIRGQRIEGEELIRPGQKIRVGATVLELRGLVGESPPPAPVEAAPVPLEAPPSPVEAAPAGPSPAVEEPVEAGEELAFERTVVIPFSAEQAVQTRPVEEEGELLEVSSHKPFLLDEPLSVWYVVSGGIDIFTVGLEKGKPVGARSHFLGILPGQCFFGFDFKGYGMGSAFLAVGKQGTKLRKIPLSRFREIAATPQNRKAVVTLVETWVGGLTKSLNRDVTSEGVGDLTLTPGEEITLSEAKKVTSAAGVVWVDIWSGSFLFNDMAAPVFKGTRTLFPVTPDSWIQPVSDEFEELPLSPLSTDGAVRRPELWQGLEVFHRVLCECEFIEKKLAAVDEFVRLEHKAKHAEAAREAAYDAIGSVLSAEAEKPREFLETGGTEPVFRACQLVGAAMGMTVKNHPDADEDRTYEENVNAIASASGCRTRVVALRGEWWKEDHGPLLGQDEDTKGPVAILPASASSYELVDPKTGERKKITANVAASLSVFAYAFYRPFPDGALKPLDVVRFGAQGLINDLRLLIFMGVTVGLLGTMTPYLTGRVFDSAIPQAERGMLLGFGIALFGAALATSMFKLVQGVATVRVQGKMEYSIQAALWDRLMNLPTEFFRNYSAGDLSDRAGGIDRIQTLISGAGVAAILGSFSGLFYVVLMFTYDMRLAGMAIVLTLTFVGVTMLGNYLQLRHQRVEIQMQGRITGLVLNLITGVTKLRISGAEPHAFRVWAQNFANQRRVSFSVGRIQNILTVFTDVFPIISSMAIFMVMIYAQVEAAETGEQTLTTGDFIAFNSAYGLFLAAMQALGDASMNLLRIVPFYERLAPILTTPAEVDSTKVYPGKLQGKIELSHLHFRYQEDGPWIVKDLSLELEPGEFVAFVGGSGCGKSTLMRLMLGFERPAMGAIYYDGQDLSSVDVRMLRQQLGVVLQVSRVLPTDIYRNIVGVSSRSLEEAWDAAEKAGLADDIKMMPMGMHTYVSEGGGTLSGGQRQRLLIARAIVNKPKIIFLDEATSALDNKAQAMVTESMDRMDSTRIVIAHRLSTVVNANKICYLEGGRIAEMGTYDELMAKDGLFAVLAKRQMA